MKPRNIIKVAVDLRALTTRERLDLLQEIWASLEETPGELTRAQRLELDRRINDLERDPVRGIPWEDVLQRIRRRRA